MEILSSGLQDPNNFRISLILEGGKIDSRFCVDFEKL